ncbi:MAG: ABC transporter permease [Fulvivirga sp.]
MSSKHNKTPKLANWLLLRFLRGDLAEEVLGDLEEKYFNTKETHSTTRARLNYWYQVFNYLRPFALKNYRSSSNFIEMNTYNIKIALRHFAKHKSTFFINLFGLSTGLAAVILIALWVFNEMAVDQFHEKKDRLYQVMLNHQESDLINTGPGTPARLAEALKAEIPEIKEAVVDTDPAWFGDVFAVRSGDESYKVRGKFSEPAFFKMFSYPFKHGDKDTALPDKNSVVISETLAVKLFETTDVVGKTLSWSIYVFGGEAKITGVMETLPKKSTEQFDLVLPAELFLEMSAHDISWGNYNTLTYVELHKGANKDLVNEKIENFIKERSAESNVSPFLAKYSDRYLYGNYENGKSAGGRILYVQLFSVIAIFIMIIACVNFMNLSTAKASVRLKEIGLKKSLGVKRGSLIIQFLTESVLLSLISLGIALIIVNVALPLFSELMGNTISFQFTSEFILTLLGIMVFTGLLAGSYPALFLSKFDAIKILKGNLSLGSGGVLVRKVLVIFQFTLSIILIVSVIIISEQIDFIQNKNLGYDGENIIMLPLEGKALEQIDTYVDRLEGIEGVIGASAASATFIEGLSYTTGMDWEGKSPHAMIRFERARVYYDLLNTMGIEVLEGRDFSDTYQNEDKKIIFNETAIKTMGLEDPIGKTVKMWGEDKEIIGVVKDFHFTTLHNKVTPMFFHYGTQELYVSIIKLKGENIPHTIADIKTFYKDFNPGYSFEFKFLDQEYQQLYDTDQRVAGLSKFFAVLAIVISCLGLFGLATFTAERRLKEISIRKVLGAESWRLIGMMHSQFTVMILLAILIASPISYFLAEIILNNYAYRIDLNWWFFALSGLIVLTVSWATITTQTVKAATVNPVDHLNNE